MDFYPLMGALLSNEQEEEYYISVSDRIYRCFTVAEWGGFLQNLSQSRALSGQKKRGRTKAMIKLGKARRKGCIAKWSRVFEEEDVF